MVMSQYPENFSIWLQSISDNSFKYIIMLWSCTVLIWSSGVFLTPVIITLCISSTFMGVLYWVYSSFSLIFLTVFHYLCSFLSFKELFIFLFTARPHLILLCPFAKIPFQFHRCWKLEKYFLMMLHFCFLYLSLLAMCLKGVFVIFLSLPE